MVCEDKEEVLSCVKILYMNLGRDGPTGRIERER